MVSDYILFKITQFIFKSNFLRISASSRRFPMAKVSP